MAEPELTVRCCDQCWHGPERKCPDYIACLTQGPLCHKNETCAAQRQHAAAQLRNETVDQPHIFVGTGTCGRGAGAEKTIRAIESHMKTTGKTARIIEVGCIGLCSAEPVVDVQLPGKTRVSFQNITADKVPALLEAVWQGQIPEDRVMAQFEPAAAQTACDNVMFFRDHPFFKPQIRWVLANCGVQDPGSIYAYLARGGYQALANVLKTMTPMESCECVVKSGLRGRGGGGFLAGTKWKMAQEMASDQKYFVCNADEGDPGAFMDRSVIEGDPHLLLEGLAIAAYSIGASRAYIYIRAEYPLAIQRLKTAIAQAAELGILGANIFDSGFTLTVTIKQGAGAFVCGEETALIHSIEGKRGMPRPRPPYPSTSGLFGKPTVINNVETLANVPRILANGPEWFSAVGTASSKGTKVFALSGKVNRTGLIEIGMGLSIRDIIFTIADGIPNGKKFKAVQMGGPSGGCLTEDHLDTPIDYESLKQLGAMMGSGGMVVMDEDNCMVDVAQFFMEFIQRESCGKCIPCREGTRQMLEILNTITRSTKQESGNEALNRFKGVIELEKLARVIRTTSLCGLGQSAPNPVLTTLRWFREEYETHIFERRCPAGCCSGLVNYTIVEAACRGCTLCAKKCPEHAIVGSAKAPHFIVADKCISCGECMKACRFNAVVRK